MDVIDLYDERRYDRDESYRRMTLTGQIAAEQRRQSIAHIERHAIEEGSRCLALGGEQGLIDAVELVALASRAITRLSAADPSVNPTPRDRRWS
jgi:hypothetical protein